MSSRKVNIILSFEATITCETGISHIVSKLVESLNRDDWNDGRCGFPTEMLAHALNLRVKQAVRESVSLFFQQKYGNEAVQVDENTQISKAYLKEEEWLREDLKSLHVALGEFKASS
jgi:hypothetical protein